MLTISTELLTRIYAHLEAGYPNEACGILLGEIDAQDKTVKDLALVANVWETESAREGQRNRYLISPEDVARADRQAGTPSGVAKRWSGPRVTAAVTLSSS